MNFLEILEMLLQMHNAFPFLRSVEEMGKHSPHEKRYTLSTLLFLFLFLSLCFYLTKRAFRSQFSLYKDSYYYGLFSPGSGNSSDDPLLQSSSAVEIPVSTGIDDKNGDGESRENIGSDEAEKSKDSVLDNVSVDNAVKSCNLYVGSWVKDEENYPIYKPGTCPYVDRAYDCQTNGRKDVEYMKWRWKPDGCNIPR